MAGFSDFYTGAMAPPDRLNGTLVPSTPYGQPTSLAQIYAGIIPSAPAPRVDGVGEGLTALGGWNQFDDQFNAPVAVHPTAVAAAPRISTTVNAASPLDIGPLGLTSDPFRPTQPAVAAITAATPFDGAHGSILAHMFGGSNPGTTDWSVANPGDGGLYGVPAQGRYAGNNSGTPPMRRAAPAPAAPPPTPVQSLASMFTPTPITYTPAPANYVAPEGSPNQSFEKQFGAGSLTQSMKDSSRWNSGY